MASAFRRKNTPTDFLAPLTDPDAIERLAVTESVQSQPTVPVMDAVQDHDEALVGTLVHRLFQFADELRVPAAPEDIEALATRLIRPEERATAADAAVSVSRAIAAWTAMKAQPGVSELLESGERMHELPFSLSVPGQPRRVVRGTIDCLVRRPDGSVVVIEFKTGAFSPSHQSQLDVYVAAARAMFPGAGIEGKIVHLR